MRLGRAIDRYLGQMQVERDWTARTIDSVYRCLAALADDHPDHVLADFDGRKGTDLLRDHVAHRYGRLSATTRATRISYLHSFFAWAEREGFLDDDPARRIKRPPKRRPDVYRPSPSELLLGERACETREVAAWALMARRGFRASTVIALRWGDLDLRRGRARVIVKGGHRDIVPLGADLTEILQHVYRDTAPDQDDHVFTVEREVFDGVGLRIRKTRDPKRPATQKDLWRMVRRVCQRAGIRPLGPHALRHGFATGFLRDSDRDVVSLQRLLGHSRIETTKSYVNELDLEELDEALERASTRRHGTSPDDVTSVAQNGTEETLDATLSVEAGSGGGGNRTRVLPSLPDDAEGHRTGDTDPPRLVARKGQHNLAGTPAGDVTPTSPGGGPPVTGGEEA